MNTAAANSDDMPAEPDHPPQEIENPPIVDDGKAISVAPTTTLGRRGFLLLLASVACFGAGIYSLFPSAVGGPPLPVDVQVVDELIPAAKDGMIGTPSVVVQSQADHKLAHLTIILNGHYLLARQSPLEAGERLVLPQAIFTDKRSSRRFNPALQVIEKVVVRGQLPTGTRGVSVFEFKKPGQ